METFNCRVHLVDIILKLIDIYINGLLSFPQDGRSLYCGEKRNTNKVIRLRLSFARSPLLLIGLSYEVFPDL